MCKCGCNTCETKIKGPLLTEGKVKSLLSEGLQYHIDKKIPLFETVYRIGSDKHLALIKEARKMYSRNVIDLCEEDESLIKTHLGEFGVYEGVTVPLDLPMLTETDLDHFGLYETVNFEGEEYDIISKDGDWVYLRSIYDTQVGRKEIKVKEKDITINETKVPLDLPMLNEQMDIYDDIANSEFGMDYDQLGSNEKEWVRDEIDNMSINEDVTSGYTIVIYNGKRLAVDSKDIPRLKSGKDVVGNSLKYAGQEEWIFAKDKWKIEEPLNESDSNYPDFDLNKNIRYQDTSISSGMWRYTGKEQGGKGVYRNLNNGQILAFDRSDFDIFRKNLSSHFDLSESINESKLLKRIDEAVKNALTEKKFKKKEKKDPPLNKPKRGGSKAYYVYVRDPKTKKIKKVSFGSGGLRAKIKNKDARTAFAARHNCKNKKDRTKAGYWSCNLPRYAPALGLGAKMNTYW